MRCHWSVAQCRRVPDADHGSAAAEVRGAPCRCATPPGQRKDGSGFCRLVGSALMRVDQLRAGRHRHVLLLEGAWPRVAVACFVSLVVARYSCFFGLVGLGTAAVIFHFASFARFNFEKYSLVLVVF